MSSNLLQAQAGTFGITATTNDLTSGITRCTINWNNLLLSSVKGINIIVSVSGTSVCVNNTMVTDPTVINSGFTTGYTNTFTNTGLTISRFSSMAFTPPTGPYTPLVILAFKADRGSLVTISVTGTVIPAVGSSLPIAPASTTWTVSSMGGIIGDITKPSFSAATCQGLLGLLIPGVTVTKDITTTGGGTTPVCVPGVAHESTLFGYGSYDFPASPFYFPYKITPKKNGTDFCCGITSNDMYLLTQYVIGYGTFNLAQVLAADFNQDGTVTTYDKVLMNRCLLGLPLDESFYQPTYSPWRFVPFTFPWLPTASSSYFSSAPNSWDFTPTYSSSGSGPAQAPFWGVKRGDIDGDCEDCGNFLVADGAENRASVSLQDAYLLDRRLDAGEEILLPILASGIHQAQLFGMELFFDPNQVEVLAVVDGNLPNEYTLNNVVADQGAIAVRYSWMGIGAEGTDISAQEPLFYVRVRAKQDISSLQKVVWQDAESKVNWLYSFGRPGKMAFHLSFLPAVTPEFSVVMTGPNPALQETQIDIILPEVSPIALSLLNQYGQTVSTISKTLPGGRNSLLLSNLPEATGLYTIVVQTSFGQKTLRFIKI